MKPSKHSWVDRKGKNPNSPNAKKEKLHHRCQKWGLELILEIKGSTGALLPYRDLISALASFQREAHPAPCIEVGNLGTTLCPNEFVCKIFKLIIRVGFPHPV